MRTTQKIFGSYLGLVEVYLEAEFQKNSFSQFSDIKLEISKKVQNFKICRAVSGAHMKVSKKFLVDLQTVAVARYLPSFSCLADIVIDL